MKSQISDSADCRSGLDVKAYVTRLEVSPTRWCSFLVGLRISSQSSDHLDLAAKVLRRAATWFRGGHESAYSRLFFVRLSLNPSTQMANRT